jgi:mono/diheme cytochrome c family protein
MRKVLRISGILLGIIVLIILGSAFYIKTFLPNVGAAPDIKIVSTTEKIERGKYLANHVTVCMDCHSTRDWKMYAGPMMPGNLGKGGEEFNQTMGFPGVIYAANITPAGISSWTDGEIFRAITTGVRKNGKPIFPVMPHRNYGTLDPEDIEAIICYLRSLPPVENKVPESQYDFPMNFIVNTIPVKAVFSKRPDTSDVVAYGKYMVTAASCRDCHTPFEKGQFDTAFYFAGGRSFQLPVGLVTTANLTPDNETGTGTWNKEIFVNKFVAYRDSTYAHRPVDMSKEFTTMMPWYVYAGMTDYDLGDIYVYLQSLKPIKHAVVKFQSYKGR